jgi:hypothetical protein
LKFISYLITRSVVPLNNASIASDASGETELGLLESGGVSGELRSRTVSQLKKVLVEAVLAFSGSRVCAKTPFHESLVARR